MNNVSIVSHSLTYYQAISACNLCSRVAYLYFSHKCPFKSPVHRYLLSSTYVCKYETVWHELSKTGSIDLLFAWKIYCVLCSIAIMVCIPCIVIPLFLWIFHKFIRPLIQKFWGTTKGQESLKSTELKCPMKSAANGDVCKETTVNTKIINQ